MIAALHKDAVNIGLEIEGLRSTADIFEMRISPALHMPVAASDSNADCIINLIGEQRLQLITPTVAIFEKSERKIGTQQMVVVAGKPDIGQDARLQD